MRGHIGQLIRMRKKTLPHKPLQDIPLELTEFGRLIACLHFVTNLLETWLSFALDSNTENYDILSYEKGLGLQKKRY